MLKTVDKFANMVCNVSLALVAMIVTIHPPESQGLRLSEGWRVLIIATTPVYELREDEDWIPTRKRTK